MSNESGRHTAREEVLTKATDAVMGARNKTYGPPTKDFDRSARVLTSLGFQFQGGRIHSHHIAMIQIAVKLTRLTWSPNHEDSWVDLAGYAANGYECATIEVKPDAAPPAVSVTAGHEDKSADNDIQDLLRWFQQRGWTELPARGVGYTGVRSPCGLHQRWIHKSPSSAYYVNHAKQWALDQSCPKDDHDYTGQRSGLK
jgi:hypothetical protein